VSHVLRIGGEQIEEAFLGGIVAEGEKVFVFGPIGEPARNIIFLEGLGIADAAIEEMVGVGNPLTTAPTSTSWRTKAGCCRVKSIESSPPWELPTRMA
jgi:hypothetical protein